jgi:hypothetical protein
MLKRLLAVGCFALLQTTAAHALFVDFESVPGLTPTPSPAQGGLLNNNSELNDEIVPLRITSGALSSDAGDSFPSVSGLLNLTGTSFGPARSGTNVVAGLEGGSGGPGSQAIIDFKNFVEIRVLQSGFTFVSEWIQLFGAGTTASVKVCGDLNCGDELTTQVVNSSTLFSFTAPAGKEIRNIGVIPIVPVGVAGGMWIDDVTLNGSGGTPGAAPEPSSALLAASALALLAWRRSRKAR